MFFVVTFLFPSYKTMKTSTPATLNFRGDEAVLNIHNFLKLCRICFYHKSHMEEVSLILSKKSKNMCQSPSHPRRLPTFPSLARALRPTAGGQILLPLPCLSRGQAAVAKSARRHLGVFNECFLNKYKWSVKESRVSSKVKIVTFRLIGYRYGNNDSCEPNHCHKAF